MQNKKTIFVHSSELDKYPYPPSCPFNTSRAGQTYEMAKSMGLLDGDDREVICPDPATVEQILSYHDSDYIDILQTASKGKFDVSMLHSGLGTGDCPVFEGMFENFALCSGASITAAEKLLAGEADIAFNPSGGLHHAHADRSSGFCYVNDIVLACQRFTQAGKRVAFLDIDVHHTDGVQEAFYETDQVLTVSTHETGKTLFPGTGFEDEIGKGDGKGYSVNLPMPAGTYDMAFLKVTREVALPVIRAYDPDVIVLEVGADTLSGDPLAHLSLTNNVLIDTVESLMAMRKPLLVTGGGGYNVENTVRAWTLLWAAICGEDTSDDMMAGMGGVMMESTEWHSAAAALRDRTLVPDEVTRQKVDADIDATIEKVKKLIFPKHGL